MPKRKPVIKSKKALRKIRVDAAMETPEFWDKIFDAISQATVPFIIGTPFHSPTRKISIMNS